ncbi:MAG TPA: PhzF family phenazine biosynthesis protein [Gemmatimonadaceae bacterium]|nr:PhzF family phenazine biosynthesis protein [Gemmatimonadaceae bacterium]
MPSFKYLTADVFTNQRFGGNQLAVFPDASGIDPALMPKIAREFNFSETTFVLPPADPKHTRRVRIFTPGSELPFAGHPTVGTAFILATIGDLKLTGDETRIVFEEGVGPVPVTIRSTDGTPGFAQLSVAMLPEVGPPAPSAGELAKALGLGDGEVLSGEWGPEAVSCGVPFLFVPLKSRDALARARVRLDVFERLLSGYVTAKVFVFCNEPELAGSHYRARMFAPSIGVPEDPATGSACAGFGGYLGRRDKRQDGTLRWVVEQGFEMGRPSILEVETDKRAGAITAVRVGGESVLVSRGEFLL